MHLIGSLRWFGIGIILTSLASAAFPAQAEEVIDPELESLRELLNTPIVIASKSGERLSNAPGIVSVITEDEIQRFGGTNLKEILERVPNLIGFGGNIHDRSAIVSRGDQIGSASNHVLLLINGRPVREILVGGVKSEIYQSFPVNVISRIEVIRGPGSVLYGSNAFSAVINVITKKATDNGGEVAGFAGPKGLYGTFGGASVVAGDFSLVVAARNYKKDAWVLTDFVTVIPDLPPGAPLTPDTDNRSPNYGPGVYLEASYKKLKLMSTFDEWDTGFLVHGRWNKLFSDLGYELVASDKWNMEFHLTYSRSTYSVFSGIDVKRDSYEVIGEWTNFVRPIEELKLVAGVLVSLDEGKETTMVNGPREVSAQATRKVLGGYLQADYALLENLNLVAGLQVNKIEGIGGGLVPRGGIIWHPFGHFYSKLLYSQAYRAPSIFELTLEVGDLKGNPNLKSEKVSTVDVSIGYEGDQAQAAVTYFHSKQTNTISEDAGTGNTLYGNVGEATFQGVEVEGKWYLNKNLYLNASLNYQRSKDVSGAMSMAPVADFGAKAGASYQMDNGITLSVFDIYQGDFDKKFKIGGNPHVGPYNLFNAHLNVNMNQLLELETNLGIDVFVQLDNLFDREVWNYVGFAGYSAAPYIQGRSAYAGVKLRL